MKKLTSYYVGVTILLAFVSAQAATVGVYNGHWGIRTFARYVNGSYVNQPLEWQNVPAGETRYRTETDGNLIQVEASGGAGFAHPTAGVNVSGTVLFIYFSTNTCVMIDKTLCYTNNASRNVYIVPYGDGEAFDDLAGWVYPGGTWCWTFPFEICTNGHSTKWEWVERRNVITVGGDGSYIETPVTEVIGSTGTNWGGTNWNVSLNAGTNPATPWQSLTNTIINFTGTGTGAARDDTLKAGFSRLALQNEGIQDRLLEIAAGIQGIDGGSSGGSGTVDVAAVVGELRSIHNSMTNTAGVQGQFETLTNLWGTPDPAGQVDFVNQLTDLQGLDVEIGAIPAIDDSFWKLRLMSSRPDTEVNLRPSAHLPGVASALFQLLTWLTFVGYGVMVMRDIFEIIKVIASTTQLNAAEAEATIFGIGGNWGILTAGLFVPMFLAIWAVALLSAATGVNIMWGTYSNLVNGLVNFFASSPSGPVAQGWAEASQWLPVGVIVQTAVAYISWLVTKNFTAVVAVKAQKLMIG